MHAKYLQILSNLATPAKLPFENDKVANLLQHKNLIVRPLYKIKLKTFSLASSIFYGLFGSAPTVS